MSRNNIKQLAILASGGGPFLLLCLMALAGVHVSGWMVGVAALATVAIYVSAFRSLNETTAHNAEQSRQISGVVTSTDKRLAPMEPITWRAKDREADVKIDPKVTFQNMLGFGASLTGSSCAVFARMPADKRSAIMTELFDEDEMNLSVCRTSIGSSDYSPSLYSYCDGTPDPELKRFSIEPDRAFVLPMLHEAREINPDMFLLSSPWSPPGWMKPNGTMLGGAMGSEYFPSYANYFVKFVQAYRNEGIEIQAVTIQNEVEADQGGHMPACTWTADLEIEFVKSHLGPAFVKAGLETEIWMIDHNYDLWPRAIKTMNDVQLRQYCNSLAWHGYHEDGPHLVGLVHEAHPDVNHYFTEFNTFLFGPDYLNDWARWGRNIAGAVRNHCRSYTLWNVALDEQGKPNIGPFPCGGVVTINSQTHEVVRSGGYWGLAHFSKYVKRGAKRIDSRGELDDVTHVAFKNPDGQYVVVIANTGAARSVAIECNGNVADVAIEGNSLTTLTWS